LDYATPYEVFKKLTGIDAIILVKGIPLWVESAKIKNKLFPKNNPETYIEEDYLIDGRIDVRTNYGSEETIKLQENLFIEKLQINIEDDISDRQDFSNYIYKIIIDKIELLIQKRNQWNIY
jgi:hypothetical protein